jgi:hypothetical protein
MSARVHDCPCSYVQTLGFVLNLESMCLVAHSYVLVRAVR